MKTILVIDDEINYLNSTIDALKTVINYNFIAASNSNEALEHIKHKKIDLLITDYVLDGNSLNGDDIIKFIRDKEKRDNDASFTPCIIMTASEKERLMTAQLMNLNARFYSKSDPVIPALVNLIEDNIRSSVRNKDTDSNPVSENVSSKRKSIFNNRTFKLIILPILIGLIILLIWNYIQPHLSKKDGHQNSMPLEKTENLHIALNVTDENNNPIENAAITYIPHFKDVKLSG